MGYLFRIDAVLTSILEIGVLSMKWHCPNPSIPYLYLVLHSVCCDQTETNNETNGSMIESPRQGIKKGVARLGVIISKISGILHLDDY